MLDLMRGAFKTITSKPPIIKNLNLKTLKLGIQIY